jgi:hypothetical protein
VAGIEGTFVRTRDESDGIWCWPEILGQLSSLPRQVLSSCHRATTFTHGQHKRTEKFILCHLSSHQERGEMIMKVPFWVGHRNMENPPKSRQDEATSSIDCTHHRSLINVQVQICPGDIRAGSNLSNDWRHVCRSRGNEVMGLEVEIHRIRNGAAIILRRSPAKSLEDPTTK